MTLPLSAEKSLYHDLSKHREEQIQTTLAPYHELLPGWDPSRGDIKAIRTLHRRGIEGPFELVSLSKGQLRSFFRGVDQYKTACSLHDNLSLSIHCHE